MACTPRGVGRGASVISVMSRHYAGNAQQTRSVINFGGGDSHMTGQFFPVETPRDFQRSVTFGNVAIQLNAVSSV